MIRTDENRESGTDRPPRGRVRAPNAGAALRAAIDAALVHRKALPITRDRLRTRIVQAYDEIDPHPLNEALATAMRSGTNYLRAVQDYVNRTAGR